MAEFLNNAVQAVSLNQAAVFDSSIPCNRGNVFHADGTGNFILRGNTPNCFARYQVVFNGKEEVVISDHFGVMIQIQSKEIISSKGEEKCHIRNKELVVKKYVISQKITLNISTIKTLNY